MFDDFPFRIEAFLKRRESFRRSAFYVISKMVQLCPEHPSVLVEEVCLLELRCFIIGLLLF